MNIKIPFFSLILIICFNINVAFSVENNDSLEYGAIKCFNPFLNRLEHKKYQDKLLEDDVRPKRQKSYVSKSGYFLIHYDIEGEHKVDLTDIDKNGIPDYVDSTAIFCDEVFKAEIEEVGFIPPLKDTLGGNDKFDVYLTQLTTDTTSIYGFTGLDYETILSDKFIQGVCYIYIDNDYSIKDSIKVTESKKIPAYFTTGYEALKITIAHEFHHAIQFAYGYTVIPSASLNEMYSTFMERLVYPNSKDYYQYFSDLMYAPINYPFGLGEGKVGYRWSVFPEYLYKTGGNKLLRKVWELISNENDGYTALDSSLIYNGSSLNEAWKDFMNYVYFTSTRAQGEKYLSNASELRKLTFSKSFNIGNIEQSHTDILMPYQIVSYRVYVENSNSQKPSIVDFVISNYDSVSVKTQELIPAEFNFIISKEFLDGFQKIDGVELYYKIISDNNKVKAVTYVNEGILNNNSIFTFPQPYRMSKDEKISFSLVSDDIYETDAQIEVFDNEMLRIYNDKIKLSLESGYKSINIMKEDLKKLGNGIFYYLITTANSNYFGKFVIIN